ncbi:hypothetical protein HYX13_01090 [Candidatus Woesearchaeota archaeon]|nr:hypothetical protein [Candidatus Woesearchaeota archaeon]
MKQKRGLFVVLLGVFLLLFSFAFWAQENSVAKNSVLAGNLVTGEVVAGNAAGDATVNCGTVRGCELTTQADCDAQGGTVIAPEDDEIFCSPICCQIFPTNFCEYGVRGIECQKLAERDLGRAVVLGEDADYFFTDVHTQPNPQQYCLQQICVVGEVEKSQLIVIVKNQENIALPEADVVLLQGEASIGNGISDSEGKVILSRSRYD